jgi:hypothetical protein
VELVSSLGVDGTGTEQHHSLEGLHAGVLKDCERILNETVRGTGPVQERLKQVNAAYHLILRKIDMQPSVTHPEI